MSDLISRSELLKEIEVWDGCVEALHEYIQNMPTAYDIDKVVEELEKLADENYKAYCIAFNSDDRAEYDAYTNAIEIVKQGSVGKVVE